MDWVKIPQDELVRNFSIPPRGSRVSPAEAYALAYQAALQGAGLVKENPLVGAVLVDAQHRFIALGWHQYFGGPHAEAALLAQVKSQGLEALLEGATLYCTLEPCCYRGKTPACTEALKNLPLARVVIAETDPNPRVNGAGLAQLQEAGIAVEISPAFRAVVEDLTAPFRCVLDKQRPLIAAKIACSLDGMIGYPGRNRWWITNERARRYAHWLRCRYDGIVVGAATVIADNPALDATLHPTPAGKIPWKIILDPQARALRSRPLSEMKLLAAEVREVLWVMSPDALAALPQHLCEEAQARRITLRGIAQEAGSGFVLADMLGYLRARGVASLLLEGGREVWGSFARAGLVDELFLFQAPQIIGLPQGLHWSQAFITPQALRLEKVQLTVLDDNLLLAAQIEREGNLGETYAS